MYFLKKFPKWMIVALSLGAMNSAFAANMKQANTHKSDVKGASSQKGQAKNTTAEVAQFNVGVKKDKMEFDVDTLTAKPGQKVVIKFTNSMSKDMGLKHNLVIVKPGTEAEVAMAGLTATEAKNYVPEKNPNVIKATKLLASDESESIEFTAPTTPGEYPFICTYPGHYVTMKGKLVIK